MNKSELIDAVAKDTGETKAAVTRVLDAIIDRVTKTVSKGDDVALTGFGTFSMVTRAARDGRNPSTGEHLKIAATKSPKFKAGTVFKAAVAAKRK